MRIIVKRMIVDAMLDRELTTVISSHNLKEINEICDRAALLHQGKIVFSRDLDSLKGDIHKVQAAFPQGCEKEDLADLEILHFEKQQSITYLIVKGDIDTVRAKLNEKDPVVMEIDDTLEAKQKLVGGLIEVVPYKDNLLLICNEEGKITNLKPNLQFDYDYIVGNCFVVGDDFENGGVKSVEETQIDDIKKDLEDRTIILEEIEETEDMEF